MEWTYADTDRAAKEGWRVLGGYVVRTYDHFGLNSFPDTASVIEFLRDKGKESEWHKQVYLSLPWTAADDQMATFEGWRLAFGSILTRNTAIFKTSDIARGHVIACAENGDPLHIKALSTLAKRRLIYGDQ